MTMMMMMKIATAELNADFGEEIVVLEPRTLIGAFTHVRNDLVEHVRKRDLFAETTGHIQAIPEGRAGGSLQERVSRAFHKVSGQGD